MRIERVGAGRDILVALWWCRLGDTCGGGMA
jgi:hypothetical protein